jgi:flagellin
MPSVLNTNIASLFASKNLEGAQSAMASSVERLSSGLRINRAKDDAAGLGISQALTSQINGANQGVRNVNDGISMVQTAEAALSTAAEMGQRILTLATQAANGSLSSDNRKSIQSEMSVLLDGIASISLRTKFGDKVLLSASTTESIDAAATARYKIQMSNDSSDVINLTNDAFRTLGKGSSAATEVSTFTFNSDLIENQSVTIGGKTVTATGGGVTAAQLRTAFGAANGTVGNAETSGTLDAGWTLGNGSSANILTATYTANTTVTDITSSSVGSVNFSVSTVQGSTTATGGQSTDLAAAVTLLGTNLGNGSAESTLLTNIADVQLKATNFLTALSTQRSKLGALQNHMESSISNVQELSANLSSAKSRIQDTDYAAETAALTKGQILQQAATAMLAQANQMPNVILSLLK